MSNYSTTVSEYHHSGAQRSQARSALRRAALSGAQRSPMADLDLSAIKDHEPNSSLETKTASVAIYADMLTVKRHYPTKRSLDQKRPASASAADGAGNGADGGKRQPISDFSRKSRSNMNRLFAKLRNVDVGAFATLTYPGKFHGDWQRVKRDLKVFKQRLERKFPDIGYIWRLELKTRKSGESRGETVPHFHMVMFGVDVKSAENLAAFRTWLCENWHEVVGYGGSEHREHGADVSEIRSRKQARHYVSKYAAKPDNCIPAIQLILCGRRWGIGGKLDTAIAVACEITHEQAVELRRVVVRWMKSRGSAYAGKLARYNETVGFSAFGLGDMSCEMWLTLFDSTAFRMLALI